MLKKKSDDEDDGNVEEVINDEELSEFFEKYSLTSTNDNDLPKFEERILYHLSGHTIFSTIKLKFKTCGECLPLALTDEYRSEIAAYQEMKDYTGKIFKYLVCDHFLKNY